MTAPAFQEIQTGASTGLDAVGSAALSAEVDHLYLAYIWTGKAGGAPAVTGVVGLGLTWSLIAAQCNGDDERRIEVWWALGTPSGAGAVDATLAAAADEALIAVQRRSGVKTSGPIGAIAAYNTNGLAGACSGGAADDSATASITTTAADSVVTFGVAMFRGVVFSHTAGWIDRMTDVGSTALSVSLEDKVVTTAGAETLGAAGNLGPADVWVLVAVEILAFVPPPPPPIPATRELVVRAYHGDAGEYLEDWRRFGAVEITVGLEGPRDARIEVDRHRPYLHHTRSMPGGVGVLLEIDGAGLGAPLWTGRAVGHQFDGDGAAVGMGLRGPEEWLSRIGVPMVGATARPAPDISREAIETCRVPTWIVPGGGASTRWSRIPVDLSGQTIWALLAMLAEQRGEEFCLTPRPRQIAFDLDWRHPLDSPEADVVLEHGRNCTLSSSALNTGLPLSDAVGVALSYGAGDEVVGSLVKAPPTGRLGTRDALTAALSTLTVRKLAGAGSTSETVPAPEITSQAALDAMVESMLRRSMSLTAAAQIQDVDQDLWHHLRPGTLVRTRLPDPYGLFSSAVARIVTATFSLAPTLGCALHLDLWSVDGAHA